MVKPLLAALLAAAVSAPGLAQSPTAALVAPGDSVAGLSQAQWSVRWWQWAGSFERSASPVADTSGELCGEKQHGPVWFLAGTYGTRRTIRTCTVPAGRHLFFPLINYVVARGSRSSTDCLGLLRQAAAMTEPVAALVLELDGVRLPVSPQASRLAPQACFNLAASSTPQATILAAANGYYAMLPPLSPGTHTLHFGGALPDMLQAVSYTLHVK